MKDPLQEPSSYIEEQGTLFWVALAPPWGLRMGGAGWELPIVLLCAVQGTQAAKQ